MTAYSEEYRAEIAAHESQGALELADVRNTYYAATGKTSDIARNLALAGVAFIWVFSGGNVVTTNHGVLHITNDLLAAGLAFVIALGLDLIQYAYRSGVFGYLQWSKEKQQQDTGVVSKFDIARPINYVTLFCFWSKVVAVIVGYVFLGLGIADKIH